MYFSEVRWLNRGIRFKSPVKRFFILKHDIEIFLTHKGKRIPKIIKFLMNKKF
jgi:hypothetical protein